MNTRKLLRKAIDRPQSLRFADAVKLAEAFGFARDRVTGSHHIFKQANIPELLNLQNVGGMAKAYQVRQLLKIAEKHNLPLTD